MRRRAITFSILLLFTVGAASSQDLNWYSYNEKLASYVPSSKDEDAISTFIAIEPESKDQLNIKLPTEVSIYIENGLVYQNLSDSIQLISYRLDSLKQVFEKDTVFMTFYGPGKLKDLSATVNVYEEIGPEGGFLLFLRELSPQQNFFIVGALITLFTIAIWRNQLTYQSLGNIVLGQLFSVRSRETTIYNSSYFQLENLQFFFLIAFCLSINMMYLYELMPNLVLYFNDSTFLGLVGSFLVNTLIYYLALYVKFVFTSIISTTYQFRNFNYIQHYDFLRIAFFAILILLGLIIADFILDEWMVNNLGFIFISVPLILVAGHIYLTYLKLNKLYSNKKLHIISYLCVTEIIPIILIVKISR